MNDLEYRHLKNKIRELINIDLDNYKTEQMRRRLDTYVTQRCGTGIWGYCDMLERNRNALAQLRDFITINVSEFFRDPKYFEVLKTVIIPKLLRHCTNLNIWSAGCATGAEAYSVAIILEKLSPFGNHRILATDIDHSSLSRAISGGPYDIDELKNVSQDQLDKYFRFSGKDYWIINRLRDKVEFRIHDLLQERYESGLDIIICRNLLIYLSDEAQTKIEENLHESLKENGMLFIGATETMRSESQHHFIRMQQCFYRKSTSVFWENIENRGTDSMQGISKTKTCSQEGSIMAKVIIADDSAFMRGVLKAIVERDKHSVIGMASNGEEALKLYVTLKPDVMLLDIFMEGMDGIATLREIRKRDPGAKIIIISAFEQKDKQAEARVLGVAGYINKPFKQEEVSAQMNKVLLESK